MNWSWYLITWKTSNVQPKCQGPLQLLSPSLLMTSTTKQMWPNEKGGVGVVVGNSTKSYKCSTIWDKHSRMKVSRLLMMLTEVTDTAGTTNAMDVLLNGARQVKVNDVFHVADVQSTSSHLAATYCYATAKHSLVTVHFPKKHVVRGELFPQKGSKMY